MIAAFSRYAAAASEDTLAIAEPGGIAGDQRLGELPHAQEVDPHHQQRVTDARGHPGDVEQRVDRPVDRRGRAVDRRRVGQVDLDEIGDAARVGGATQVQPGDPRAELGELAGHLRADARRAAGDHDVLAVVAHQLVECGHGSARGFPCRFALLLLQLRGL